MKLIIKQYLTSLRERGELDAILPDLLSQMGLTVFSRPQRGTRQDGVDVAATGSISGGAEKIYLFSIKAGDITRISWDGDAIQSLRPSLNEVLDAYIPNRLPAEHKEKEIVICLCFGGDIQEQVRPQVEGYIKQNSTERIKFEEWNGDKLAELIQGHFLREDLLPEKMRSQFRKALALLDEPTASFRHFSRLIQMLSNLAKERGANDITILRQIYLCLWILFSWSRDADNLESAYLPSELAVLYSWNTARKYIDQTTKPAQEIHSVFLAILGIYHQISSAYFVKMIPVTLSLHAATIAVRSHNHVDINLKLFDLLGRLSLQGIWASFFANQAPHAQNDTQNNITGLVEKYDLAVKQLITNNPILLSPIKDDQVIDITLAVSFLLLDIKNRGFVSNWLQGLISSSIFSFKTHGYYPCIIQEYAELLEHPEKGNNEYRKRVTSGSVYYSMIAFFASILGEDEIYSQVQEFKKTELEHCNFQLWYPDDTSEEHFYLNSDIHGATLSHVDVDKNRENYLSQVFNECNHMPQFSNLSAVKSGLWPLVFVACRHYRLPLPVHLWASNEINSEQVYPETKN